MMEERELIELAGRIERELADARFKLDEAHMVYYQASFRYGRCLEMLAQVQGRTFNPVWLENPENNNVVSDLRAESHPSGGKTRKTSH